MPLRSLKMRCHRAPSIGLGLLFLVMAISNEAAVAQSAGDLKFPRFFDATISLESNPATQADRAPYEDVINFWADAVCEMTNGAHRLQRISVFTDSRRASDADIRWRATGDLYGPPGGWTLSNWQIGFADTYRYPCTAEPDGICEEGLLNNPDRAGYVLAHEWAHYVYLIFDEYDAGSERIGAVQSQSDQNRYPYYPRVDDDTIEPSIMSSVWTADDGRFDYLNFSTAYLYYEYMMSQGSETFPENGQTRIYNADAWTVLARDPRFDSPRLNYFGLPARPYFPELQLVRPTGRDRSSQSQRPWIRTVLGRPSDRCRDALEIIWTQPGISIQVVIDRSGSMGDDNKLILAKQAARRLVEFLPGGESSAGLISFGGDISVDVPLIQILQGDDEGRIALSEAIDMLQASGGTPLYDGALEGLRQLESSGADDAAVIFLLSDGEDTGSTATESDVVERYSDAGVSLFTFGFGDAAPHETLRRMADQTGGEFRSSPASSEIEAAFIIALSRVTRTTQVGPVNLSVPPVSPLKEVALQSLPIDQSLESFDVLVQYQGDISELDLLLESPSGAQPTLFQCERVADSTSCIARIDSDVLSSSGKGEWLLSAANLSGRQIELTGSVFALPTIGTTYAFEAENLTGNTVSYPDPILLTASMSFGDLLTGLHVDALITAPDGTVWATPMKDDGEGEDLAAADGIYSAFVNYFMAGTHQIDIVADNRNRSARFIEDPTVAGQVPDESFSRAVSLQVDINGFQSDDHPDDFPGTSIEADNTRYSGRVDRVGDIDLFAVSLLSEAPVSIRVSDLGMGMDPRLTLLDDRGQVLSSGTLDSNSSRLGYLFLSVRSHDHDGVIYARVEHRDPLAASGLYRISAGRELDAEFPSVSVCRPGASTLCLGRGRDTYEVTVRHSGDPGSIMLAESTLLTRNAGFFSFGGDVDVLLKVLDGWEINGHRWVFVTSQIDEQYVVRVVEMRSGRSREYIHGGGALASFADTHAFSGASTFSSRLAARKIGLQEAPHSIRSLSENTSTGACVPTGTSLCILDDRLRVEVGWSNPHGLTGIGRAFPLSQDTGSFWFFDSENLELLIRAKKFEGRVGIQISALSNVGYQIRVTDTKSGQVREYTNPQGTFGTFLDPDAFPEP